MAHRHSIAFATILVAVCLFGIEAASAQKIYEWVDDQGRKQFTQTPPPDDTAVKTRELATNNPSDERLLYCRAVREMVFHIITLKAAGTPVTMASVSAREFETRQKIEVEVEDVALRELVNYVYANYGNTNYGNTTYGRGVHVDVSSGAYDACLAGNFGKPGRGKLAKADGKEGGKASQGAHTAVSGTGWVTHGLIATNYHVIEGRDRIRVRFADGREANAFLRESDQANDVALLRVSGVLPPGLPLAGSEAEIGADVFTLGYPHTDIMGNNAKLSTGIVNSRTGLQDDPRLYQISVPVQSGNSGGPLVNREGCVVGIVTAKLSAAQVYKWTGDIPQNVTYAVKVSYLALLMRDRMGSTDNMAPAAGSLEELAKRISPSVVLVIAE